MDDFLNVTKKDPKVRIKVNDMLDRYNRLPYDYRSKIWFDTLIQNVILKELINMMGTTITDLDIELKLKISRIEFLESKTNSQILESGKQMYSKSCDVDSWNLLINLRQSIDFGCSRYCFWVMSFGSDTKHLDLFLEFF